MRSALPDGIRPLRLKDFMYVGATLCGRPRLEAITYFKIVTFHSGEATEGLPYMVANDLATALFSELMNVAHLI
jgi:hypothetical protein